MVKVLRWESQAAWLLGPAPADALVLGEHVPRQVLRQQMGGGARDSGWNTVLVSPSPTSLLIMERWFFVFVFFFNLNSFFCSWRGIWMLLCHKTDTHQNAKLRIDRYTLTTDYTYQTDFRDTQEAHTILISYGRNLQRKRFSFHSWLLILIYPWVKLLQKYSCEQITPNIL